MIRVSYIPCLFEDRRIEFDTHNLTPYSILIEMARKNPGVRQDGVGFQIRVNGKRLSPFKLKVPLQDGDRVLIVQEVEGELVVGIIGAIAGISVSVLTIGGVAAATVATIINVALAVISIAYSIYSMCASSGGGGRRGGSTAGNLASAASGQGLTDSPTYGWDGVQTQAKAGVPVPIVYGEHLAGGNIIGAYVSSSGSTNYLNLLIALSEGPIEGIMKEDGSGVCTNPTESPYILINDQPISNFGIAARWDFRLGEETQSHIPAFRDLTEYYPTESPAITYISSYTYTTTRSDVEAFELRFRVPGLYQIVDNNYAPFNIVANIFSRVNGTEDWVHRGQEQFYGISQNALRQYFRVDNLSANKYDIKVVLITADPVSPDSVGTLYLDGVNEISYDVLTYPFTSLVSLRIQATDKLSGQVPNVQTLMRGKKVKNLDTTLTEWTRNAIYNTNDLLISDSGAGRYIAQSEINVDQLIEQANCCDEIIGDGNTRLTDSVAATSLVSINYTFLASDVGRVICCKSPGDPTVYTKMTITSVDGLTANGTEGWDTGTPLASVGWEFGEKRYELDVVIDTESDALSLISQLCSTFRCVPLWAKDAIQLIMDRPQNSCYAFNMSNIIEGSFTDTFTSQKSKPNSVEINFADRALDYTKQPAIFVDHSAIEAGAQLRPVTMEFFGATRLSQVAREARFHVWAYKYQDEQITFKGGIDSIHVLPGDIIKFQHDVTEWGTGGRIVAATIDSVTLDKEVEIEAGESYQITVRQKDGSGLDILETRAVTNPSGFHNIITVDQIVKNSSGSTFNRGDFTAINAFFWSSLDLSPYAGTDLGSTPFYIELLDAAGKLATGYIGAVGAGETLGSEIVVDLGFADAGSWNAQAGWEVTGGKGVATAVADGGQLYQGPVGLNNPPVLSLIKGISTISDYASGKVKFYFGAGATAIYSEDIAGDGTYTKYGNVAGVSNYISHTGVDGNTTLKVDNFSIKRVTDPPSTAVHIVSSLNGTTRAWESIESGFDPNNIASWEIRISGFSLIPETYGLWLVEKVSGNVKTFRVMSTKLTPENEVEVVASEYHTQVYSDTDIVLPVVEESTLPHPYKVYPVTNLAVTEKGNVLGDGTWTPYLEIGFTPPEQSPFLGWDHVEIWLGLTPNFYEYYGDAKKAGFKVDTHDFLRIGNTVYVKAVSVNKNGIKDDFDSSPYVSVLITGKMYGPGDITTFTATQYTDMIILEWTAPSDKDIKYFEIREGSTWESSQLIATQIYGNSLTLFFFETGWQNYLIKAIDTSGNYSSSPAIAPINVTILPTGTPLTTLDGLLNPPTLPAAELDFMEYASDVAAQMAYVGSGPVSEYPTQDDAHVKATTKYSTSYWPYFTTNPTKSLIGDTTNNQWVSQNGVVTNQRFHIDLGEAKIIKRIYYENGHSIGASTNLGVKDFTFWGSNDADDFADLVYANDGTWVEIDTGESSFSEHVALNQADSKYIDFDNETPYRYYAFKFADNWGHASFMGVRRIELQTVYLRAYSENTIKVQGTYSLRGIALITDSLNKTLTRTVSPAIDLTDRRIIKFDIRASRTGSNIKIGIHDSGGVTTEITPDILVADTWQTVEWDIYGVSSVNKDAIDQIIVTIVNADVENTFYIDNLFTDITESYLVSTQKFYGVPGYPVVIGLAITRTWDSGAWDSENWDRPLAASGYFVTEIIDLGSTQHVSIGLTDNYIQEGDGQTSTVYITTSEDNLTWTDYVEFSGTATYLFHYAKFKVILTTDNANENIFCTKFDINVFAVGVLHTIGPMLLPGSLSVSASPKLPSFIVPYDCTLIKAFSHVQTAPTGADLIFDIHKNGTTIWATQANRLKILSEETDGIQSIFDTIALSEGDYLDLYVDQIGSSVPGSNASIILKVTVP